MPHDSSHSSQIALLSSNSSVFSFPLLHNTHYTYGMLAQGKARVGISSSILATDWSVIERTDTVVASKMVARTRPLTSNSLKNQEN